MVSDGSNCSARAKSSCANLSVALLLSRAATRACNRATRLSTSSMAFCNCQYWPLACASRPRTAAVAASKSAFAVSTASSRSAAQPAGAGRSASERAGIGAASRARVTAAQAVNAVSWFTRWAISTVLIRESAFLDRGLVVRGEVCLRPRDCGRRRRTRGLSVCVRISGKVILPQFHPRRGIELIRY